MPDKNWQFELEEYIRQGEPERAEKSEAWQTAIGLQAVDGLNTSEYLLDTAKDHIDGDFTLDVILCGVQQIFGSFQPVNCLQADSSLPRFTFFGSVWFALPYIFFKFKLPILIGHICTSFLTILPS